MNQFYQIKKHPINNSKSKQLYSFPKADRFHYKTETNCSVSFYEIRDGFSASKKGVSFGYGNKTDFAKLATATPPPNYYQPQTARSYMATKSQGFGIGRVVAKQKEVQPGPGFYEIPSQLSKQAYSIRLKNEPSIVLFEIEINSIAPGPGKYQPTEQSHISSVILKRPQERSRTPESIPGPQRYEIKSLSPNGKHPIYQSNQVHSFAATQRFPHAGSMAPGPGHYAIPGEFGMY